MASKEPPSDYMAYKTIIWTFPCICGFNWHLTFHGLSAGDGEQLRQTHTVITSIYIDMFNFYYYCFHSIDILEINNRVGLIIDFFEFKTMSIS